MKARIYVTLRDGVLDPQGEAVRHSLGALGFDGIKTVRQGKVIDLEMDETDPQAAQSMLHQMCEKLLANTVIEDYSVEISQ